MIILQSIINNSSKIKSGMEGEIGLPPNYDHLQQELSFSAPHEMGYLQFEDHNQAISFLEAPSQTSPVPRPLHCGGGGSIIKPTNASSGGFRGFSHSELLNRPSCANVDQVFECFYSLNSSSYCVQLCIKLLHSSYLLHIFYFVWLINIFDFWDQRSMVKNTNR